MKYLVFCVQQARKGSYISKMNTCIEEKDVIIIVITAQNGD